MIDTPIWQAAVLLTFGLVIISIIMQIISNFSHDRESNKTSTLILSNQYLSTKIQMLQDEIANLNKDLLRLTIENQNLNTEVGTLTNKVLKLQQQIEEK